jgi:hypothetical protein
MRNLWYISTAGILDFFNLIVAFFLSLFFVFL